MNTTLETAVLCAKCGQSFRTVGARANKIRNNKCCSQVERFWQKVEKRESGCWIYQGCRDKWGYAHVGINGKRRQAHRYSYELANGPIPVGKILMHSCDNPPCVNPAHLSIGTDADNHADAKRKGRNSRGEKTRRNKLTEAQVIGIRNRLRREGPKRSNCRELAEEHGVNVGTIHAIEQGRTWAYLK